MQYELNSSVEIKLPQVGTKILAKYYSFFLCINIFLPKVDFGFGQFYIFDFVNCVLLFFLVLRGKLYLRSTIILSYIAFIFTCYVAYVVGLLNFSFFDTVSFFRLIKFTVFILFLVLPYYIYDEFTLDDVKKIINYQIVFIVLAGLYTIYHMIFYPLYANDYSWSYDNKYRLIGLTSYVIDIHGNLKLGGSTSVSMGVFVAFIFFVLLSFYKFTSKRRYLIWATLIFILEFFTYSRAGILVMITGLSYYFLLNVKPGLLLRVFALFILSLAVSFYFNLFDKLATFGTLAKITNFSLENDNSIGTRVKMLYAGFNYILEHPLTMIWGSGYGEEYTLAAIGFSHLEGLIPTILFTAGIFSVALVIYHFYTLWETSKRFSLMNDSIYKPFLYAVRIFIPGWFLSALAAGNTFQTDYYFPLIYFIFFVSYFKIRKSAAVPS